MKEGIIMGKQITLTRSELIWQTRQITWDETDWEHFVEWLKGCAEIEDETAYYKQVYGPLYEIVKDMTWEQVIDDFNKREDNDETSIKVQITRRYNIGLESEFSDTYTEYLADAIEEAMREDCYDSDVISEDYADDYNEDFQIFQDEDKD